MTDVRFSYALSACGLSDGDAASYLQVSVDSIRSWKNGRRKVPSTAWQSIATLHTQIQNSADAISKRLRTDRDASDDQLLIGVHNDLPNGARRMALAIASLSVV